jgi:hypothetical protein
MCYIIEHTTYCMHAAEASGMLPRTALHTTLSTWKLQVNMDPQWCSAAVSTNPMSLRMQFIMAKGQSGSRSSSSGSSSTCHSLRT